MLQMGKHTLPASWRQQMAETATKIFKAYRDGPIWQRIPYQFLNWILDSTIYAPDVKIMTTSPENSHSDSDVSQYSLELDNIPPTSLRFKINSKNNKISNKNIVESQCMWNSCGLSFATLDSLAAHVGEVHAISSPGRLYYCGWEGCGRNNKAFNARYKMLVHVRTHTNEKPHQCYQCNKSFSRAENLKIHSRSHSGEKPYTCPVPGCAKAYSNSSDRFKHTRTHQVDKPYKCKVPGCSKKYTDPSSLRKHVKTYKHFVNENASADSIDDNMQCGSDCDCTLCTKDNLLLLDIREDKCWNKILPSKLFVPYDLSSDKMDIDMPLDLSISRKTNVL